VVTCLRCGGIVSGELVANFLWNVPLPERKILISVNIYPHQWQRRLCDTWPLFISLLVGLLSGLHKCYRRIWLKFLGKARLGPAQRSFDFGGDPDRHLDPAHDIVNFCVLLLTNILPYLAMLQNTRAEIFSEFSVAHLRGYRSWWCCAATWRTQRENWHGLAEVCSFCWLLSG